MWTCLLKQRRRDKHFSVKWARPRCTLCFKLWKVNINTRTSCTILEANLSSWLQAERKNIKHRVHLQVSAPDGCQWPAPTPPHYLLVFNEAAQSVDYTIKLSHIKTCKSSTLWPPLAAAVFGIKRQGYLVHYLWLVLLMSDLLWTMRRTEVNSNEHGNERLQPAVQNVGFFVLLFTERGFFFIQQKLYSIPQNHHNNCGKCAGINFSILNRETRTYSTWTATWWVTEAHGRSCPCRFSLRKTFLTEIY